MKSIVVVEHAKEQLQRERLRAALQQLRSGARRRSPRQVREVLESALAKEPHRLAESAAKGPKEKRPKEPTPAAPESPPSEEETDGAERK